MGVKIELNTPPRTPRISRLKSQILKPTFLSGRFFYFEILQAPSQLLLPIAKRSCPESLNWPGRLAGISEGASRISK